MNQEFITEQKRIDDLISIIKADSKEKREQYNEARKNFYKIQVDFAVQRAYQLEEIRLKDEIGEIDDFISKPYIGRLKTISVNGELNEVYIGRKDYRINNDRIIYSVWSSEGRAFSGKTIRYHHLNVIQNRIVDIRDSLLKSYFDVIKRVESELDIEIPSDEELVEEYTKSKNFSDLIEINKRRKEILTTLSNIQNKIIDLPINEHVIIHGVPGSGKTIIGGYRLSSLAYNHRETSSELGSAQFHYYTTNDSLKLYSLSFFSKIDLEGIQFYSIDKMYDFNQIESDDSPTNLQVYNKKNDVKGKLISREDYNDPSKDTCEVIVNRKRHVFIKKNLMVYRNNFTQLAKDLFGSNSRKVKVDTFISFRKSRDFQRVFQLMNGKLFVDNYLIKLNKKYLFNTMQLKLKISKEYGLKANSRDCQYIIDFIKLYNLVNNNSKYFSHRRNVRNVFVDEGQDYCLAEYALFAKIYSKAKLTICGDVNQSNGISPTLPNWKSIQQYFDAEVIKFNTCYRSSVRVVQAFNSRMVVTEYGTANNYINAKEGFFKHIKKLNIQNRNIFSDFSYDDTALIYINDEDLKIVNQDSQLSKFQIYKASEVKGMEFENVILFLNGYNLRNVQNRKFNYMLISRALVNFVSINKV